MVEMRPIIVRNPTTENLALPCDGGNFETLKLTNYFEDSVLAAGLRTGSDVLPMKEPLHESCRRDRLNLLAQCAQSQPVDAGEQATLAPFLNVWISEFIFAPQDRAAGLEAQESFIDLILRKREDLAESCGSSWTQVHHPARKHGEDCIWL